MGLSRDPNSPYAAPRFCPPSQIRPSAAGVVLCLGRKFENDFAGIAKKQKQEGSFFLRLNPWLGPLAKSRLGLLLTTKMAAMLMGRRLLQVGAGANAIV